MTWKRRIRNPRFLLAFPPQQYASEEAIRPDGTLALPYLDAALTAAGFESAILDMSIGTPADRLEDTFYRQVRLENGYIRIGMSPERILEEVRDYDVIALTSIFTQQTSRCFEVARLVKQAYPDKILIAGGVNARALKRHFFDHGFDVVFTSEGEKALVDFARFLDTGAPAVADLRGVSFRDDEQIVSLGPPPLTLDLDEYPMPSWDKLPNQRYWDIGRVWGGREGWVESTTAPRYAAVFTSRGCPFRCMYCHISLERGGEAGDIANLRLHSVERVASEFHHLRDLGVQYLYINDDSFLAKRERVLQILGILSDFDFRLADVNGVNIIHFFKREGGRLVVDDRLLEALYNAGFRKMSLPFESGTQRLLDKYSTGKWRIADCDFETLIRKLNDIGIVADANFMIGYPDETLEELTNTFLLARRVMDAGLVAVQFFMVQPFPGSRLFDESIANGQLRPDWHWDDLGWSKGSPFTHPAIDRGTLKYCWSLVWKLLNRGTRVEEIRSLMP
jgi:radical SAM superfamily enzyme YgiQ (UPF0313 family)